MIRKILICLTVALVCVPAGAIVMSALGVGVHTESAHIRILTVTFPFTLAFCVGIEEALFRAVPLGIALGRSWSPGACWMVAVPSSVVFGYIHGDWRNIFVQGIFGIIASWLFMNISRSDDSDGPSFGKAFLAVWIMHFCYDAIAIAMVVLHGGREI